VSSYDPGLCFWRLLRSDRRALRRDGLDGRLDDHGLDRSDCLRADVLAREAATLDMLRVLALGEEGAEVVDELLLELSRFGLDALGDMSEHGQTE
jgi:hypothetical protein